MNKKVSELTEATDVNDEDILMIIQNNENKQTKVANLMLHKYTLVLTNAVAAGANITIPCYYVVRSKCNGCVFKWRTPIAKFRRFGNRWTL